jgi:preprotein translocase subunit SecD
MALADFIQALQEEDVVYSEPRQPSIRVIPPDEAQYKNTEPKSEDQEQPTTIRLKIKKKQVESAIQPVSSSTSSEVPSSKMQPTSEKPKPTTLKITRRIEKPTAEPPKPVIKLASPKPEAQTEPQVVKPTNTESKVKSVQPPVVEKPATVVEKPTAKVEVVETPTEPVVEVDEKSAQVTKVEKELSDEEIFLSTGTELSKRDIWFEYFAKAKTSRKKNPIVDRMKVGRFTITPDNKVLLLPDYDIVGKDPDDVLKDKWF